MMMLFESAGGRLCRPLESDPRLRMLKQCIISLVGAARQDLF